MSEKPRFPLRIMIVDDETKNIQVLGTLLQQKGYYIYVAQNGKEALEIIKEVLPDLILLDIMMPEPDGFEVCHLLKSEPKTRDIPVIFLTVKSDSSDIIKGFELGAADYVTKPFNSVELLARINTHLNLRIFQNRLENQNKQLTKTNELLINEITERKAAEKEIFKYQEKLKSLHSEMLFIEERERRLIAVELHENIGQNLALLKMKIRELARKKHLSEYDEISEDVLELTDQIIQETRYLTFETSPPILYELGLGVTIQWLIEKFESQYDIEIEFINNDESDIMDEQSKFVIYRVIRELIVNIIKHSKAKKARVSIGRESSNMILVVEDYGIGFDTAKMKSSFNKNKSFGLFSINERLAYIGGEMDIQSAPGSNTKISLLVPLKNTANSF
ncbi:Two component system response regulator/histidine kinase [Desulfonema limicola]|uniref:Two component system response regulator/histidine kinase n=1 Tax=Desulfonema limicola TaxID=45656 RepID=A0A975GG50_9BACT|nr:response regulator [Desulfonema limicola]QTA79889.1 Two component system response regulator/histidine kinase [Desulfonema limicola]